MSSARRVFALLGDPVGHSLSPRMHAAAFRTLALDATYAAVRTGPLEVPGVLRALAAAGGGGNVTFPLKQAAISGVDELRGFALAIGACNTFWREGDRVIGENTDVAGIGAAATELGVPPGGWLVVGTGATARAAALAARDRGAPIAVRSRAAHRATSFLHWAGSLGVTPCGHADCVFLVNTAPAGHRTADPPPPAERPMDAPGAVVALDARYARGDTAWVRAMRRQGMRAADGRAILVGQAAASLAHWYPGVEPPVAVMREAVDRALG